MKERLMKKLTSKVVWVTAIPVIVHMIAMFNPTYADMFGQIGTDIVTLLALYGILNNPDDREQF